MGKVLFTGAASAVMVLAALLVLSGCAGGRPATPGVTAYVLEYPEPLKFLPEEPSLTQDTVTILRFNAAEHCRGSAMIYRSGPFRRAAYHYHRWGHSPADMVTDYLASTLLEARIFNALFVDYAYEKTRYHLEGRVIDCIEVVDNGSRRAVLRFTAALLDTARESPGERLLFQNIYGRDMVIPGEGPAGLAAAMSEIMAMLSVQLAEDIGTVLRDEIASGRPARPGEPGVKELETD